MVNYIFPNIFEYKTINDLIRNEQTHVYGHLLFGDLSRVAFADFYNKQTSVILAEPGYGKTRLLNEIVLQAKSYNKLSIYIDLKKIDTSLVDFIDKEFELDLELVNTDMIICLDALDEIQNQRFSKLVKDIKDFIGSYPNLTVLITCRRQYFIKNKYLFTDTDFSYFEIATFTLDQSKDYLKLNNIDENVVNKITQAVRFQNRNLIIQVPRYLEMFASLVIENDVDFVINMNRNELFDYFIYGKLTLEQEIYSSYSENKLQIIELIKRVLEKLALVMEMFQTNTISKENLMTFFDDIKSNLCVSFLNQVPINILYERSLLKQNLETIEFENVEFQEYLAAKELARLGRVDQVLFDIAIDQQLREIVPSWFNTITFLLDIEPSLIIPLIKFASSNEKILDNEEFHRILTKMESINLSKEEKYMIFQYVFHYYQNVLHWIDYDIAQYLVDFYDVSLLNTIKESIDGNKYKGTARTIRRGNAAYVLAFLLKRNSLDVNEKIYWKNRLINFLSNKDLEYKSVLQRRVLFALQQYKDISILENVIDLIDTNDELVEQELLKVCTSVDPNHQFSIKQFVEGTKRENIYARYGLHAISSHTGVINLLDFFTKDHRFTMAFLDKERNYKDRDDIISRNIINVFDNQIKDRLICFVHFFFTGKLGYRFENSKFILDVLSILKTQNPDYIFDIIMIVKNSPGNSSTYGYFNLIAIFEKLLDIDHIDRFIRELSSVERGDWLSLNTLIRFKDSSSQIYEKGRTYFADEYQQFEQQTLNNSKNFNGTGQLYQEFQFKLQPELEKYDPDVFRFYLSEKEKLSKIISKDDIDRLKYLIKGSVFDVYDPSKTKLQISNQSGGGVSYTTDEFISIFGDCINLAVELEIDISKYRKKIISYIPFAYHEHLKAIFSLVPDLQEDEVSDLLNIYLKNRDDDLARFMPMSFVESSEQYRIKKATPILKTFVDQKTFSIYDRSKALGVIIELGIDENYLESIFEHYEVSENIEENQLIEIANEELILTYNSKKAIQWRFNQIISRAFSFREIKGVHSVGMDERELREMKFAAPLNKIKDIGLKTLYVNLLKVSFQLSNNWEEYGAYSQYLWKIIIRYFDNLKEYRSYSHLTELESELKMNYSSEEKLHVFHYFLKDLKKSYINFIGKPTSFSECINEYNKLKDMQYKNISTALDLAELIKNIVQKDIRFWVESEGAYSMIQKMTGQQEDLIQKTLKTQFEVALLRRGIRETEIRREEQLLDGKRIDFLISYGFTDSILIEIKRVDNKEIIQRKEREKYKDKLLQYVIGTKATHGIFLLFQTNNKYSLDTYLPQVVDVYNDCENIEVIGLNCIETQNVVKP